MLYGIALLALIGGCWFRFANIGGRLYWFDEAMTSMVVSTTSAQELSAKMNSLANQFVTFKTFRELIPEKPENGPVEVIEFLKEIDPHHSPIFYSAENLWAQVFGMSPKSLRAFSALLSLSAIAAVGWLCLEAFSQPLLALLASALVAISPIQIIFAQQNREYAFWVGPALALSALFIRALRTNRTSDWGLYSFMAFVALYTQILSAAVVACHALLAWRSGRAARARFSAAALAALLAFIPWALAIFHSNPVTSPSIWLKNPLPIRQYVERAMLNVGRVFLDTNVFIGEPLVSRPYTAVLVLCLLVLSALALLKLYYRSGDEQRFSTANILLPILALPGMFMLADLILGGRRGTIARYFLPACAMLSIAVAHLIWHLARSRRSRANRASVALCAAIVATGTYSAWSFSRATLWWTSGPDEPMAVVRLMQQNQIPLFVGPPELPFAAIYGITHLFPDSTRVRFSTSHDDPNALLAEPAMMLFKPSEAQLLALRKTHTLRPLGNSGLWLANK